MNKLETKIYKFQKHCFNKLMTPYFSNSHQDLSLYQIVNEKFLKELIIVFKQDTTSIYNEKIFLMKMMEKNLKKMNKYDKSLELKINNKVELNLSYLYVFQEIAIPLPCQRIYVPPSGNLLGVTNFPGGAERNFLGVKKFPNDFNIIINY